MPGSVLKISKTIEVFDTSPSIPALDVNERKPTMYFIRLRLKIPKGFVCWNGHGHFGRLSNTDTLCDEHPHLSWVEAF